MALVNRKSVFEHVQNAQIQIILHMHKVSSGPLLYIHAFCSIQYNLLVDNEGPGQTEQIRRLIWASDQHRFPKACFHKPRSKC